MIKPFQNNNIINRYRDNNNNNIKEKDDIYYYHIGNLFKDIYIYRIYECFLKPYNIVNMNRLFEFCSRNICCESIFSINNHMNKLNIYKKNKNKYNAHIQYNILTFICSLLKEINYIDEYIFCNFLILLFLYKFLSKEKQKDILYTIYDSLNKKKKYIYFPPFITLIMDERRKKKQRKYLKKLNNETKTFNKNNLLFCFSSLSSFSSSSQKENLTSSSEMLTETTSTTSSSSSSPSSSSPSSDDDLRNCLDPFELGLSDTYHNKSTNSFSRNYSMKKKNSTQEKFKTKKKNHNNKKKKKKKNLREENKLHFLSGITEGRCAPIPILVNIEYADNNCGNEKVYMKVGKSSIERINNTKEKKDIILNGNNYVDEKSFDKDKKSDNINEESHNTSNNINIYNDENVKECSEKEDCKMNNTYKDVFKYNPFNEEEKNVKIQNMCSVNEIKNVVITLKNNLSVNLVLNNVTLISSGISIENYPSSIILLSKKKNNKLNKVQLSFKAKETGILFILGISYCISYYYFDQYLLYNTSALRRCFMKNEFFDHYNDNHKTSHEKDKNTSTFKKETGNVNDKSCLYGYISDHNYMYNKHLNNMSTIQRQSFSSHKNNNNNKNNISSNNTFYCADHVNNSFYYFEDMHKGTSSTIYKRAKLLNYIFKVSSICSIFVIDDYFSLRSEIKLFNFSKYINIKELLDDHSYLNKYVTSKNNEKKKESNIECNNIYLNHITKDNSHVYHLYDKHNNSVLNNTQTFKNLTQGQVISNKYKEMYDNNDNNDNINSNDDICYHTLVSEKLDNNVHDLKNEPICMTKNISNDKKDIKCNNQNGNKETDSMTTKKSLYKKQHVFNRFLLHKRSSSKRLSLSFSSSVLSSKSTLTFTGSSSSSSSSSTSSSSSSSTSSSSSSSTSSPSPGVSPLENIHPEDLDSHTNDHSSEPLVLERKKQIRFQALYRFKDNVKKKGHKKYPHIMEGVNDDHIKNKDNISYNKEYEDSINDLHNNLYFSYDARFAELLEGEIKFLCLILENKGNMDIEFLNIKINYKHKNINGDYFIKFFFEKAFYIKNEDMHSMVTNNNNIQNEKMMSEKMVNEKMVNEENIIRINKGENLKVKKNSCLYIPIRCIGSMLINECYLNIFYSPYKDSIYYAEQKIKLKINVKKNISIQNIFYFPYVSFNYLHILNKLLNSNYYETNIINILGTIKKRERTKYIPSTEEQENRVYNNYYNGSSDNIYNNNYLYHDDNMCNTFMTKESPLENIHPEDLDSHTNDHSSEPLVLERKKQIRFQALYRFKDNVKKKGHKKYPHIMEGVNDDHIKNKDNISYNKEYEDSINDLHNNLYFSYDARFAELLEGEIKFLCLILENKGNMDIEFLNIKINYKHKNINGDYFIKFFFEKAFYIKNEDMHSMVTNNNNIQNEKMMSEKMVNEKMVNEENIIRINKGENLKVKKNSCLYIPIRCIGSMLINECYLNIFYSPYKDSIYYAEQKIKLKINVKKNISIQNIFYFPYVSFNYLHILNKLLNSNYYETNIINILGTIKKRERTKYIPSTEEQENRVYNNYYNGSSDNIYNNNYLYHDDNMCNTFMTKEGLHSQNNKIVKNILKLKKRMKNTIIRDDILYNMNDNNMQLIQNFEYMNKIYYEYKENLNICTDNKYIFLELYIKNHSGYVNYCKTKKLKRRPTCIVDKENNCSKWLLWIKRIKRDENLFFENEEDILNYFLQYVDCNVYLTYSRHKTVGLLSVYGSYLNSIHLQNKTLGDFFWNVTKAKIQKSTIQLNNNICDDHNGWDDHNIWDDDEKKNKCSYYQEKRETDFLSNTLNFPTPFKRHEENKNGNKDNNDLYNTYHVSNIQDAQDKNEINKSDICMKKSSEINEFIEKDNYDESHNNISLNLKNNAQYLLNVNKLFEKNFFNDIFYPYILIIPRFFHCKKKNSVIIPKCSKILDMHNYKNIGIKKKYFQSKVNQTFHVKIYLKNLSNIELGKYTLLLYPSNLKSIKIIGSLNKTEYLLNNNHLNYNNTTNMLKCKKPYLLHSFSIYSLFPGKVFFYITIYLHTYNTLLFHHEPILITIV
ncbi:hypothetical protein PFFCH_04048 [Plasmodium falciparum FCH/4]|uniref:Trs120/TRAPPC9 first Ig-like domain-containing protein n=1 Tax=Plasmodium falciparum FCH/4 TaxID=1036724 RepID=A0A024VI90_PLAFA|nr:hypothetical protein PFFCH_04048 [Plasmodium falciparum FCH/4]